MATLTIDDDVAMKADEFAKQAEMSRENIVDEAIDIYARRAKEWDDICAYGRSHALKYGITEEAIKE
jgi:predicted transcriptional regulator